MQLRIQGILRSNHHCGDIMLSLVPLINVPMRKRMTLVHPWETTWARDSCSRTVLPPKK